MPTVTTTITREKQMPIASFARHKVYNEYLAYFSQGNCIKFSTSGSISDMSKGSFEHMRVDGDALVDFDEIDAHQFVIALCECIQRLVGKIPVGSDMIKSLIDGLEDIMNEIAAA